MKAQTAFVGSVVVDSLPYSQSGTAANAEKLATGGYGIAALAGYLGVINAARVQYLLDAGLGYLPVTLAGEYADGPDDEVGQLQKLGIPTGVSVFLDLEGMSAYKSDPALLIQKINTWADGVANAGYLPGLYVGVPQPLTSDELWKLRVQRYWRGMGSVRDRHGALAEPTGCGWCMTQMYPSYMCGGVLVDANMCGQDYRSRLPMWAA